jgi:hypothetical protein
MNATDLRVLRDTAASVLKQKEEYIASRLLRFRNERVPASTRAARKRTSDRIKAEIAPLRHRRRRHRTGDDMTAQQESVLAALRSRRVDRKTGQRVWVSLWKVATLVDRPEQGVARILASLVRLGLVERWVGGGPTCYRAI